MESPIGSRNSPEFLPEETNKNGIADIILGA
jgi:hypothetical protein